MADASPAAAADAAPPPPKSGSKLLIVILAVVLAAAGAGGGVYFLTRPADQAEAKDGNGKKEGKKEPKAPAVYVAFDPPFVVNFEAKGMMRFLQVSVEVMTRDPAMADMIKQHEPVLRNDLLPKCNLFGYGQVESPYGSGEFIRELEDAFEDEPNLALSEIRDKEGIYDSIKEFLGRGR